MRFTTINPFQTTGGTPARCDGWPGPSWSPTLAARRAARRWKVDASEGSWGQGPHLTTETATPDTEDILRIVKLKGDTGCGFVYFGLFVCLWATQAVLVSISGDPVVCMRWEGQHPA